MRKITAEFKNRPKNTLNFENWIADNNSSEAFSVFLIQRINSFKF